MFHIVGGAIDIIQAEGLPPGKMSSFITIRIAATICTRARPAQPDIDTLHRPPVSGASSGSLLASKPGSFLPSAEGKMTKVITSRELISIVAPYLLPG